MLTRTVTAQVPAQEEIDADLAEWGSIGVKVCAQYGQAAIEVGAPDYGNGYGNGIETDAADAITNILHFAAWVDCELSADELCERALMHFHAEAGE